MCYIMAGKRLQNYSQECEDALKKIMADKMDTNRDGFYLSAPNGAIRTMDIKKAKELLNTLTLTTFISHFRIATQGKKDVHNVHGWDMDGWRFVHNGSIGGYWAAGFAIDQEDSDSLGFFKDLLEKLKVIKNENHKAVKNAIDQTVKKTTYFNGRCLLYHAKTDRLFMFGDWYIYKIADSHIIFSSALINWKQTDGKEYVKGFIFEYEQSNGIGECYYSGVGVVTNYSTAAFKFRNLGDLAKPTPKSTYSYYDDDDKKYTGQFNNWKPDAKQHWDKNLCRYVDDTEVGFDTNREKNPKTETTAKVLVAGKTEKNIDIELYPKNQTDYSTIEARALEQMEERYNWNFFMDETGVHDGEGYCCTVGAIKIHDEYLQEFLDNCELLRARADFGEMKAKAINGKKLI